MLLLPTFSSLKMQPPLLPLLLLLLLLLLLHLEHLVLLLRMPGESPCKSRGCCCL